MTTYSHAAGAAAVADLGNATLDKLNLLGPQFGFHVHGDAPNPQTPTRRDYDLEFESVVAAVRFAAIVVTNPDVRRCDFTHSIDSMWAGCTLTLTL